MLTLQTNHPIATNSPDHTSPLGIVTNNNTNRLFNNKLNELKTNRPLYILDMGCAHGGFVHDCLNDGNVAVGVEGSDYAKVRGLGEWATIPNNLFTADITKPLQFEQDGIRVAFDVITLWEVMEHIQEQDLEQLFSNLKNNLKTNGVIIVSINVASPAHVAVISAKGDCGPGKHHQNVQSPAWWDHKIAEYGLQNEPKVLAFFGGEFVRGPGCGCDPNATEERMVSASCVMEQWATINRCWAFQQDVPKELFRLM